MQNINKISFARVNDLNYFKISGGDSVTYMSLDGNNTYCSIEGITASQTILNGESPDNFSNILSAKSMRSDLIETLNFYFQGSVYLSDQREFTLLSVYTIMTYMTSFFDRIPYLRITGQKGTGKTTLLTELNALVHNPKMCSNISPAAIFRITDSENPTLIIDEAEQLENRTMANDSVFQILNSGYEKNGKVIRYSEGETKEFSTFCPKIIAGINDMNPVTEDRCIKIIMNTKPETAENEIIKSSKRSHIKLIQEIILQIAQNLSEIERYCSNPKLLDIPISILNRDRDRWLPILLVAKVFSTPASNHFEDILSLANQDIKGKAAEIEKSPERMCENIIKNHLGEINPVIKKQGMFFYKADEVQNLINENDDTNIYTDKAQITKILRKVGIDATRRRINGGNPVLLYVIRKVKEGVEMVSTMNETNDNNKILIRKVADETGWLSCMSPHPVTKDNFVYKTCEALFQTERFTGHPEIQKIIRDEKSPMGAKMKARKNKNLLNRGEKWDEAPQDLELMKECFKLKLEQHPELKDKLIATGNAKIIEDCTSHDRESARFWGMVYKEGKWQGENKLGQIWMDLRGEIVQERNLCK